MLRSSTIAFTLIISSVTTVAFAEPVITATGTDLGAGLYAWDVFYDGNDGQTASAAVDLKFVGDIVQVPGPFGLAQLDLDDIETLFAGPFNPPGPDLIGDSYLFTGSSAFASLPVENGGNPIWAFNLPTVIDNPNGAVGGPSGTNVSGDPMWVSNGTSAGFGAEVIPLAHIVIDTSGADSQATLTVTGSLARGAFGFDNLEFVFAVPEPSTFTLLGIAMLAFTACSRRRRRTK